MLGRLLVAGLVALLGKPCYASPPDDLLTMATALCPANETRTYDYQGHPLTRRFMGPSAEVPGLCREAFTFDETTEEANTLFGMALGFVLQDQTVQVTSDIPALIRGVYPVLSGTAAENRFEVHGPAGLAEVSLRVLAADPAGVTRGRTGARVFQFTKHGRESEPFFVVAYERPPDGTVLFVGQDNAGLKLRWFWKRMVMKSGGTL